MMQCPKCGKPTTVLYGHYDPMKDGSCEKCQEDGTALFVTIFFFIAAMVFLALMGMVWLPVLFT